MRSNPARASILMLLGCVWPCGLQAATELLLEPEVIETRYCTERKGAITLRVTLQLRYTNTSEAPIIIPLFMRILSWQLFENAAGIESNRPDLSLSFRPYQVLDSSQLDRTKPDPKLFRTIGPQSSMELQMEVLIPLFPEGRDKRRLGKDHYLRVEMDTWADPKHSGEPFRRAWEAYGRFLTGRFWSQPIKIHVEEEPAAKPCMIRID
jgi:hypothetical protein